MSYPLLRRISAAPRLLPLALLAAVLIGGLAVAPPLGTVLLVLLVLFLGWLMVLSWPRTGTSARALRVVAIALLVAVAVSAYL